MSKVLYQYIDNTMVEDLIVSCCTEVNNSVADECQVNPDVKEARKVTTLPYKKTSFSL